MKEVRSCKSIGFDRVARWLKAGGTQHFRIQDQCEPLIVFCVRIGSYREFGDS
jgi:hypothetical protein